MSNPQPVTIALLPTGVPGFDAVLGGGLPEFSFTLISGTPGAGKTTLAHQIMFTNASAARPALYFTVMGEPPLKMLRYQQQLAFFDPAKVGVSVHFVDLSELLLDQGLNTVLERILQHVATVEPGIVVVDSFQAIVRAVTAGETEQTDLLNFTQRLAVHLTSWQATTFLVGEYHDHEVQTNPVLTIADNIFMLSQHTDHNSVVRKLQVVKSRGQAAMPGLHTFRMSQAGIQVYPRMSIVTPEAEHPRPIGRSATGVAGLDALVGGGIPYGDAVLVSGPSGAGKSVLAAQFIAAGAAQDEPGVIAIFEEHPQEYVRRARSLGIDLAALERQGALKIIYIRPLDLSPDESARVTFDAVPTLAVIIEVAQIERVIVNLLTNALKFSPRERPIVVQVYQDTIDAIIAVTDQGIGIAPEDLPQLFEKHYRADSVEQIAGSGLGLYSSRLIVEAHGGRLWVESTVGTGSTFTAALPLLVK